MNWNLGTNNHPHSEDWHPLSAPCKVSLSLSKGEPPWHRDKACDVWTEKFCPDLLRNISSCLECKHLQDRVLDKGAWKKRWCKRRRHWRKGRNLNGNPFFPRFESEINVYMFILHSIVFWDQSVPLTEKCRIISPQATVGFVWRRWKWIKREVLRKKKVVWTEWCPILPLYPLSNSYAEALNPNITVLADRAFRR